MLSSSRRFQQISTCTFWSGSEEHRRPTSDCKRVSFTVLVVVCSTQTRRYLEGQVSLTCTFSRVEADAAAAGAVQDQRRAAEAVEGPRRVHAHSILTGIIKGALIII